MTPCCPKGPVQRLLEAQAEVSQRSVLTPSDLAIWPSYQNTGTFSLFPKVWLVPELPSHCVLCPGGGCNHGHEPGAACWAAMCHIQFFLVS